MFLAGDTSTNRWSFCPGKFSEHGSEPRCEHPCDGSDPSSEHIRMKKYLLALRQAMLGADPLLERFDRMVDDATAAFLERLTTTKGPQQNSFCKTQPGSQTKRGNTQNKDIMVRQPSGH